VDDSHTREEERALMAIHLTPTELAREAGMHRREVITKCMQLGVPIFEGRIDKTLFLTSLRAAQQKGQPAKV
jgi:uncharacterized protein (DUF58 family)